MILQISKIDYLPELVVYVRFIDLNDLLNIECAHEFTFVTICLFSMLANRQKLEVFERTQELKILDVLRFKPRLKTRRVL